MGSHNIIISSEKSIEETTATNIRPGMASMYGLLYEDEQRIKQSFNTVKQTVPVKEVRKEGRLGERAMELRVIDEAMSDRHYAEHLEQPFYPGLRAFITSGPLVALVLEGERAVEAVRALNGATDGIKAAPGTVRGDLSTSGSRNLVHASDSPESAQREIALWFPGLAEGADHD